MAEKKIDRELLTPKYLDRYNVTDFDFIVTQTAIDGMVRDDGTIGFAVLYDRSYIGALCGCFVSEAEFVITSLYVDKEYRKCGVGTFLLDTLFENLWGHNGYVRMDVAKLSPDAEAIEDFLIHYGFEEQYDENMRVYATKLGALKALKLSEDSNAKNIKPFSEIEGEAFDSFDPEESEFAPLPAGGFHDKNIIRDISVGMMDFGRLSGYLIFEEYDANTLLLSGLFMGGNKSKTALMDLFAKAKKAIGTNYPDEMNVLIPAVNDRIAELVEKLVDEKDLKEGLITYVKRLPVSEYDYMSVSLSEVLDESVA